MLLLIVRKRLLIRIGDEFACRIRVAVYLDSRVSVLDDPVHRLIVEREVVITHRISFGNVFHAVTAHTEAVVKPPLSKITVFTVERMSVCLIIIDLFLHAHAERSDLIPAHGHFVVKVPLAVLFKVAFLGKSLRLRLGNGKRQMFDTHFVEVISVVVEHRGTDVLGQRPKSGIGRRVRGENIHTIAIDAPIPHYAGCGKLVESLVKRFARIGIR